eukprot:10911784-Karenia_brevis.AAC.1
MWDLRIWYESGSLALIGGGTLSGEVTGLADVIDGGPQAGSESFDREDHGAGVFSPKERDHVDAADISDAPGETRKSSHSDSAIGMEASGRDGESMNDLFSHEMEPMTGVSVSGDADDDFFSYGDDKERLKDRS